MNEHEREADAASRPVAAPPSAGAGRVDAASLAPEVTQAIVPYLASSPEVTEAVGHATHVALGAVLLVTEGLTSAVRDARGDADPDRGSGDPSTAVVARRVAVGAAFDAQRRAAAVTDATVKVVGPTVGWIASSPLFSPARRFVGDRVERVYETGLAEETAARDLAARTAESSATLAVPVVLDHVDIGGVVPTVLDQIDLGPVVENVIAQLDMETIVGGVLADLDLGPIIEKVLAELDLGPIVEKVLADLDLGPIIEKVLADIDINAIVGQLEVGSVVLDVTGGMKSEILGEVRNRGADGDALVELVVGKIFRRKKQLPPVAFPQYAAALEAAAANPDPLVPAEDPFVAAEDAR